MIDTSNHTAVLVFSRSPSSEARHKRLQQLDSHNSRVHTELQRLVLNKVRQTHLPIVSITEAEQVGGSFGQRISNAFRELFYQGFYNVIAIGTDCPNIRSSDILRAHKSLLSGNATLGPDERGGAYLIAMNRDMFKPEVFKKLLWQTNHLASDIDLYFESQNVACDKLAYKVDLNHFNDVLQGADTCVQIKLLLKSLSVVPNTYINQLYSSENSAQKSYRGPPQVR